MKCPPIAPPGATDFEQTRSPWGITQIISEASADSTAKRHPRLSIPRTLIDGTANVLAPTETVRRPRHMLPDVSLREPGTSFWFG